MRLRLTTSLLAFVLAGFAHAADTTSSTASSNLGNVMYVGDSLTHGYTTASYRYDLSKIYTDNGISFQAVGVWQNGYNFSTSLSYGGVSFDNTHCAYSSMRAMQVVGDATSAENTAYAMAQDSSGIQNWLGQTETCSNGTTVYSGTTLTEANGTLPNTMFVLLGTNDILSQGHNSDSCVTDLVNDIEGIVGYAQTANSELVTYVLTIPVWTKVVTNASTNGTDITAVNSYNEKIAEWAKGQTNVTVIDINKGIIDVTKTETSAGQGVTSFFISDGLHFNDQGNLLVAGNIAKDMGLGGRTVGQTRKASSDLAIQYNSASYTLTNATADSNGITLQAKDGNLSLASYTWASTPTAGFTVDFNVSLAQKANSSSWNITDNLKVSLGNGNFDGTLSLNEAYIQWGGKILYSTDLTQLADTIRIAYLLGDSADGVTAGYYVWLDDQLIGEGLQGVSGNTAVNGVSFSYSGTNAITVKNVRLDNTGSYAPSTNGTDTNSGFQAVSQALSQGTPEGNIEWISVSEKAREADLCIDNNCDASTLNTTTSIVTALNASANSTVVATIVEGNSSNHIYGNTGDYTGDLWITVSNEGSASSWYGCQGASGTLTGDAYIRFIDSATGGNTAMGAVNADKVDGNIYMEFSAPGATFSSFTQTNQASVLGSYNTDISGDVTVVINAGTFSNSVMAGIQTGSTNTIEGDTNMYVNGGVINGYVFGTGFTGTVKGDSNVSVSGGTFNNFVIGGGWSTIEGDVNMKITGGYFNSYILGVFSNMAGTVDSEGVTSGGNVNIEISGGDFTNCTGIYAGSGTVNKTISGSTTITLKDIDNDNAVASSSVTISGGNQAGNCPISGDKSLVLDHYTADQLAASLKDFDDITVTGLSDTTLSKLGGASKIDITQASALILDKTAADADLSTLTTVNVQKGSAVGLNNVDSLNLLSSTLSGAVVLDKSTVSIKGGSQLDKATVVLNEGAKLVVAEDAGVVTPVDPDAESITLSQSISSLTGTGTLENNAQVELVSSNDTVFAGSLEGNGTLNLLGAGTQTFVGAGAEEMTVNVAEGGLKLVRGNASSVTLGSLNADQGTSIQLNAEVGVPQALTVKDGLDLSNATLDITLNGTPDQFSDSTIVTVQGGNVNLDNATIKLSNDGADTSATNLNEGLTLKLVQYSAVAATASADASATTGTVSSLRAATTPTISAEGVNVDVSDYYQFYFQDFAVQTTDDSVVFTAAVKTDNSFDVASNSLNSEAGSNLLWNTRSGANVGSVLGDAREAVREAIQAGDLSGAARSMAAIAGSTINATGTAQRDALIDQLGNIRNRALAVKDAEGTQFWIEGTGAYTNVRSQSDKGGYKLSTWGGTVGADTHIDKVLTLGLALTADYGDLRSEAAERATGDLDSIYVNVFGHYQDAAWGHTLAVSLANNAAKLDRSVDYGSGSYQTHGQTHGYGMGVQYELSYDIALEDNSLFQPLFNASVVSTSLRGYEETGADNAGLKVGSQEWTTATLALGARWSGSFSAETVGQTLFGELRANISQDFGDKQGCTSVSLAGAPNQNVYGAKVGATALQISGGISAPVSQQGTVYANAGAEVRNGANSINGTIGYSYSF